MMRTVSLLVGALALLSVNGHAAMVLDRTILTFSADGPPRHDVSVSNPDAENLYLEVSVIEVANPGTPEETREVVKDPESVGLIAAPRLLMVPPGGRRNIRLVNLNGHTDRERVYRVNVTPTPPPSEAEGIEIRVLIAYQMLVFVEPREPVEKLVATRTGKTLRLRNDGNTNVFLALGQQCQSQERDSCTEVGGRRLYPGNSQEIELPYESGPVFFRVTIQGETEIREF